MQVTLGKNKIIEVQEWKTKTKKDFLNLIKENEGNFDSINEEKILNILLYPYISPNNIYLNAVEKEYLITQIRKISINDNIDFNIKCSNCNDIINVNCKIDDIIFYKQSEYPMTDNEIVWEENSVPTKRKDYLAQTIEMLNHIKSYKGTNIENIDEMLEIYDNLSLSESEKILESYKKVRNTFEVKTTQKCSNCSQVDTYLLENIPNLFDPLLPKEM